MDIGKFLPEAYNQLRKAVSTGISDIDVTIDTSTPLDTNITIGGSDLSSLNPLPISGGGGPATSTALIGTDIGSYTFNAATKQVTLAGVKDFKLEEILRIVNTTDNIVLYDCADVAKNGTISSNVITLDYDTTSMSNTDSLQIIVIYNNSEDFSQSVKKVSQENALPFHYTDPNEIVATSDIGTDNDTWVNQGSVIDCKSYNFVNVFVEVTANDSTGNQLQVLAKHTSGGNTYTQEATDSYQVVLPDTTSNKVYQFSVTGIPYIQIQTKASVVGTTESTVTINITKSY